MYLNTCILVLKNSYQEVDFYKEFWKDELKKLGYGALYKGREHGKRDGCAIFYKNKKYQLYFTDLHHLTNSILKLYSSAYKIRGLRLFSVAAARTDKRSVTI